MSFNLSHQLVEHKLSTMFGEGFCTHTRNPYKKWTELWVKERPLGQGAFGTVWLEKDEKGAQRAVKQIMKKDIRSNYELLALIKLNKYPQFVDFFGWFEDDQSIYFAMEYMEYGDLESLIHSRRLTETDAKLIAAQLLNGLNIMHSYQFCHRDLKPQNILIASLDPITVKIADFGISKQVSDRFTELRSTVGSRGYTAPEIMGYLSSNTSVYNTAVDIWSLGCLIYAIMTRVTPFPGTRALIYYLEARVPFPDVKLIEVGASQEAIRFIGSLMVVHPEDRPSAVEALKDSWFNNSRNNDLWYDNITDEGGTFGEIERSPVQLPAMLREPEATGIQYNPRDKGSLSQETFRDGNSLIMDNAPPLPPKPEPKFPLRSISTWNVSTEAPTIASLKRSASLHNCITPYCAVQHNNTSALRQLCDEGILNQRNVNSSFPGGTTLLLIAARSAHEDLIRILVRQGADVRMKNADKQTALHLVAEKGHLGIARLLLEYGADTKAKDINGNTALHIAARYEHRVFLEFLLDNSPNTGVLAESEIRFTLVPNVSFMEPPKPMNYQLSSDSIKNLLSDTVIYPTPPEKIMSPLLRGNTISEARVVRSTLHTAAYNGDIRQVKELLDNGMSIMAKDSSGSTVLHSAVEGGCYEVVELLLERGADITAKVNFTVRNPRPEILKNARFTALDIAAYMGYEGVLELLLHYGAKIDTNNPDGMTALHVASLNAHDRVVDVLLANNADISKKFKGYTALHHASCGIHHKEVVKTLLEYGASTKELSENTFMTALHLAASVGNEDVMGLLLADGANIFAESDSRLTVLHCAANGSGIGVKFLLRRGANAKSKDKFRSTALHFAAKRGHKELVELLLAHEADIGAMDISGDTPLHVAAREGHEGVARVLVMWGAYKDAKNNDGYIPLHLAAAKGHDSLLGVLLHETESMALGKYTEVKTPSNVGGFTPLHLAVIGGHGEMVALLLANGADIHARSDLYGSTPLHEAVSLGLEGIAKFLILYGANVELRNRLDQIPLGLAIENGHIRLAQIL